MFIDITKKKKYFKRAIYSKRVLQIKLLELRPYLYSEIFYTLVDILNLKKCAYEHLELYNKFKHHKIVKRIFDYNFYHMSLNFIKDFFKRRNDEFNCEYSLTYGELHLSYKGAKLLNICYSDFLLITLFFLPKDMESFLNKVDSIIESLEDEVKQYNRENLFVGSSKFLKYKKFNTAKSCQDKFSNLTESDIKILHDFYEDFINTLKISFSSDYKSMFHVTAVDLSYPFILN